MSNLNVDINYFEHRKTRRLVSLLGKDADVLPLRLWAYCAKTRAFDGKLLGYAPEEIELHIGWRGKVSACIDAMIDVGFVERIEGGFKVHDYEIEQGHLAAFAKKAYEAAMARWSKLRGGDASNACDHSKQCSYQHTNQPTKEEARQARMLAKLKEVERESTGSK
jgi:hypothetical protein